MEQAIFAGLHCVSCEMPSFSLQPNALFVSEQEPEEAAVFRGKSMTILSKKERMVRWLAKGGVVSENGQLYAMDEKSLEQFHIDGPHPAVNTIRELYVLGMFSFDQAIERLGSYMCNEEAAKHMANA